MPASRPSTTSAPAMFKMPSHWELSAPFISPEKRDADASVAVKDPSVVFHDGKWHVFMSIKCQGYTPIEYVSFDKWENADKAPRTVLKVGVEGSKYYCAPEVFYFRPHRKWYMIYQMGIPGGTAKKFMWVAYSTTDNIADPASWSKPQAILDGGPGDGRAEGGLDYWIICDDQRAYFFFTNLKGRMYRMWTRLADFPKGFAHCEVALEADIFEAAHTYRLKGMDKYLTIVEANPGGRRFYKAYIADRLDGKWTPLADTEARPFAGAANVKPAKGVDLWTDNISHGELIRDSNDETLTVDPANLRFIIQGATEKEKAAAGGYGRIPWRIGVLTAAKE
ncbi:MAG: non-reducing end alpha-L-arabinofuranosidase family hydrolase [Phycisphaerae bacterium]